MRTGTLTSPNEIVPLQIGRMPPRYPNRPVFQPATAGQTYYFKRGRLSLERLLHPAGGRLFGPVFRPEVVPESGIRLWMLWRGDTRHTPRICRKLREASFCPQARLLTQA